MGKLKTELGGLREVSPASPAFGGWEERPALAEALLSPPVADGEFCANGVLLPRECLAPPGQGLQTLQLLAAQS